jgi:acetolactate synthase-1/2/3 large subunit
VTRAEDVAPTIREAFHVAKTGRPGPVLIDITKDAQQSSCEFDWDAAEPRPSIRPDRRANGTQFRAALELLRNAQRPLILAGHGVMLSSATRELRDFCERAHIPVAMTLLGIGCLPASHEMNLGMMGMHGEAWVNTAIQEADLLLAFGMRFDDRVTGNLKTYALNAKKIHVEIDPAEVNKNVKVDVALIGDLKCVLQEMLQSLEPAEHRQWLARIEELKGDSAVRDIQNLPDNGHLYAAHVLNDLWRETDGGAVVVTDVGQHQMWEAQYYKHDQPRSLITSGGLGTMGFALPAAIGAKFARPNDEVWVVAGDGGFQMTMPELATIAQEGLDIKIALINNGYLGMVRQWQEFFYERRYKATPLVNPDFVKLVEAFGLRGLEVRQRSEVVPAVRESRDHRGTCLINFCVEQEDSVFPMVPAGADLHQMIRRPSPLVETAADV